MVAKKLLVKSGLAPSNSEAKRLIQQGGVKVDGTLIIDPNHNIVPVTGMVLQVGKRKFVRLKIASK
jgi:tyrosyl-tRNA synthetase